LNPKASIVIAAFNNAKTLRKVLEAMLLLDYDNEFEVIVVNDGSTDNTKEMLEKEFAKEKKIKVINFEKNQGVCKARNAGINAAKHEIIVIMDHDCIPAKDWLKNLVSGFSSERIGIVSSYGYYGGTSTAFRAFLLRKVNGYDESFGYYREDTDLSFRIMELGYEFKLVKADFIHDHTETKPKNLIELFFYVLKRWKLHMNDVLLYKKHPKLAKDFLHVKFGFLVSPLADISLATGKWKKDSELKLSSPRGIIFLENKSIFHAIAIYFIAFIFMLGLKFFRLIGSIKYGKLLI